MRMTAGAVAAIMLAGAAGAQQAPITNMAATPTAQQLFDAAVALDATPDAAAAARARELSEQAAMVSEAIAAQAQRVAGAPDQDLSGIDGIAEPIRALRAASASMAATAARPDSPGVEPSPGRTHSLGRSTRAA